VTLFVAPVVHSLSLTQLEILPRALLGVVDGRVAFLEAITSTPEQVTAAHGIRYEEADKVVVEHGFLCPGFIDTHTVSLALICC